MTFSETEQTAMRRALEIAATDGVPLGPNPRVGCVLLADDGTEVAEGFHRGAGSPHAEAAALAEAGDAARGTTAVVTLEPCNHTGRTGPCAEALVRAGVRRLVFAQADTNPVASGGAATVRAAGIEVEGGLLAAEAGLLNRAWTFAVEHGRPFVTWKFATTLDGRSAAADGTTRWVSSRGRAPGHAPAAGALRRDRGRHQHRRGRRPGADRAGRVRRPAAAPAAPGGDGGAGPRPRPAGLRRPRRDRAPAHPRPAVGAGHAVRPRLPARVPRGRPDLGGGVRARRSGRRGRRLRRADAARRGARRGRRPGHRDDRRRVAPGADRRDRARRSRGGHRAVRTTTSASPCARRRSPDVHRHRRGARHRRRGRGPGRRDPPDRRARHGAGRRPPRRLDRRQRVLPDRGLDSSTTEVAGSTPRGAGPDLWTADVMQETLDKTSLRGVRPGDRVNLERAVTADKRLGGHIVQGHVDGVGTISAPRPPSEHWEVVEVSMPDGLGRYLVDKGSITVDGVSLTVVEARDRLVHGQPDPRDPGPHHARPPAPGDLRQPRGRRDRQARREAHPCRYLPGAAT